MIRQEQCDRVCRILDDVLANRPKERDSLIVAVQKAFDALEQAETNCSEIPNSSDTISRQQSIDALRKMQTYKLGAGDDMLLIDQAEAQTELMMLPSAQLNHNAEVSKMGIVHCEDCEHWDTSWETVYGLHYCPMIDMSTKKNFFCKYGAEKRGKIDETD